MKKIIIFSSIIVVIFAALALINQYQNKQVSTDNPYGTNELKPETVKQLDDPNYQNIILPEELDEKLNNGEAVTVYFFSPVCSVCNEVSPVLIPKAEEMEVNLYLYNVYEFEQGWSDFNIEGTPAVIHFENGEEIARIVGGQAEETFEQFFKIVVLGE
ncbi:Thioredoxin [Evansella caseinilytica]|uniref:Thioredoxin n=1 Tax=Evansella caseinilytica TaxID=1503961 RepID=A0A1H3PQ40_9BACI|nr:thioredoxin family protein [Evansella caseinilytica]SDZ03080.1 Thioredoxin [Evansella caseinilytica]